METFGMKIAFIAHTFPPYVGGTPGRVYRISRGLSQRGHAVTVYTSTHPRAPRVQEMDGLRIVRYDFLNPAMTRFIKLPYYIMPEMSKLLTNKEELRKVDVVQTFNFLSYVSLLGACIKTFRGKPFSLSPIVMHHSAFREGVKSAYARGGLKARLSEWYLISYFLSCGLRILKTADVLAPQTQAERRELLSDGVNPAKTRVIPGSINIELYRDLTDLSDFRKKYSIDPDEKLVLFVGQPSLWKGVHHLIQAMKEVLEKVKNARLVLVGPSVNKAHDHVKQFAPPLVANRTLITGPLVGKALVSAYSAADALVLPTKEERFGTVVVEALASGLPVISTRTGVSPDVIFHRRNGFFVDYGNVQQISAAITQILLDGKFKTEAKSRRQSILDAYSSQREIEAYEKAYYDITH
jgi:glycosyltransferase involved in cell wall biosynthesis